MAADILIRHAWLVTMDGYNRVISDGAVAIENDAIIDVGKDRKIASQHKRDAVVINANHRIVLPGFVNTHTHVWQTIGKGFISDTSFETWTEKVWIPVITALKPKYGYIAALAAAIENVKSGVTCLCTYEHCGLKVIDHEVEGLMRVGVRVNLGIGIRDYEEDPRIAFLKIDFREYEQYVLRLLEKWKTCKDHLEISIAPSIPRGCSFELLNNLRRLVTDHNLGIMVHIAEQPPAQKELQIMQPSKSETEFLYRHGLLGPRTIGAHCIWISQNDIKLIKQTSTKVSHNPVSNMYLATGISPLPLLLKNEITIGLGTNGVMSSGKNDMFEVMRTTYLLHKISSKNGIVPSETVLKMATVYGSKVAGMKNLGSIEVGKKADLVILNQKKVETMPVYSAIPAVVHQIGRENVQTVLIGGKVILNNGILVDLDEEKILDKLQGISKEIVEETCRKN